MILWKDFILDDECGVFLSPEIFSGDDQGSRNVRAAKPSVMEGAKKTSNQETSQVSKPARMVGRTDLENSDVTIRMESGGFSSEHLRQRGAG